MKRREATAHPIHGFQLLVSPDDPGVALLLLKTDKGRTAYAAYREVLETMAESFLRVAASLPRRTPPQ
jgi:hypothetical protein